MADNNRRTAPKFTTTPAQDDRVTGGVPSGVWSMGAPVYWNQGLKGEGILIGVIDTGIDDTHPDLKGQVVGRTEYVTDSSRNLHGTHVAGTIAANGKIKGVAPGAKLWDYRVFDNSVPDAMSRDGIIAQAIRDSVKHGCHIINLSLGAAVPDQEELEAIKFAIANGVFVVVAAGNEGMQLPAPQPSFPGNYEEVICVAAVNFNFRTGAVERAGFSNKNPQVDVAAEGVDVYSTMPGGDYIEISGTSMATPHVAGFCALLLQKIKKTRPKLEQDKSRYVEALRASLADNTVDIFEKGNDWQSGAGFVTAYPAIPKKQGGQWTIPGMSVGAPK